MKVAEQERPALYANLSALQAGPANCATAVPYMARRTLPARFAPSARSSGPTQNSIDEFGTPATQYRGRSPQGTPATQYRGRSPQVVAESSVLTETSSSVPVPVNVGLAESL